MAARRAQARRGMASEGQEALLYQLLTAVSLQYFAYFCISKSSMWLLSPGPRRRHVLLRLRRVPRMLLAC